MDQKLYWGVAGVVTAGIIYVGMQFLAVLWIFHSLVCLSLILIVLLQSGRAADLAGAFGGAGSQTAFGPRGAATFLSKATEFLAVVFMLTSLSLAMYGSRGAGSAVNLPDTLPGAEQSAPAGTQPAEGVGDEVTVPDGDSEEPDTPGSAEDQPES